MALPTPIQWAYGTHTTDGSRAGAQNTLQYTDPVQAAVVNVPAGGLGTYVSPYYTYQITPAAVTANALLTANTLAAAGYITLAAAPTGGVIRGTNDGVVYYQLDVPRAITITGSGAGVAAVNYTVWGLDAYNIPMVEQINHPGGAVVATGKKAFSVIYRIYASAGTAANITIGTSNVFGLPSLISSAANIIRLNWAGIDQVYGTIAAANTFAKITAANTVVAASVLAVGDATSPATLTTGDVRGTVTPETNADGNRTLTVTIWASAADTTNVVRNAIANVNTAFYGVAQANISYF